MKKIENMIPWLLLSLICVGVQCEDHRQKQSEFPLGPGNDELADTHEASFVDSKPNYFSPLLSPSFFPSSFDFDAPYDAKSFDSENLNSLDLQKRISRLVINPLSKKWTEMFRVSPKVYRELRNNGQRVRPMFRKEGVEGGFKLSYTPARKRPYYYTEPEGSEFLGGPGK